jgi:hypothetical protein
MNSTVQRWLEHIRALADNIGPRGPTTDSERMGLEYCRRVLAGIGLATREDRFLSAGSVFRPHLLAALGILAAFVLYPFAPWTAHAFVLLIVFWEVLELTLRPNPLQRLTPRKPSGNVFATLDPSGPIDQDLVLIGHVDTQRTPKIFSSPSWFAAYRAFSTIAFVSFILMTVAYGFGASYGWPWVWPVSSVAALMALILLAICIEAGASPFTAGANDNATAAGLVLTLAEELKAQPLGRTRVWFVCTGCEEALHEGARTFFADHRREMTNPKAVVFEMLGCSGPAWLVSEKIVLPIRSAPALRALAEGVAADNPELGAYPASLDGGVTEMADALAAGVPAITLIGLTPEGKGPYWHLPTDTVDKMDPAAMERNYRFARAMVAAVDRKN